jgi:hypothetical protein
MWVMVALGILAAAFLKAHRMWRQNNPADLGFVTERWLSEHRAHQPGESR